MVQRFYEPERGCIKLDGMDVRKIGHVSDAAVQ